MKWCILWYLECRKCIISYSRFYWRELTFLHANQTIQIQVCLSFLIRVHPQDINLIITAPAPKQYHIWKFKCHFHDLCLRMKLPWPNYSILNGQQILLPIDNYRIWLVNSAFMGWNMMVMQLHKYLVQSQRNKTQYINMQIIANLPRL